MISGRTAGSGLCAVVVLALLVTAFGQGGSSGDVPAIQYFVSPEYPPLARRMMLSGEVALDVTVEPSGKVSAVKPVRSAHKLLEEGAARTVLQWTFNTDQSQRKRLVLFHYGFSGNPEECRPVTRVTADLLTPRVFVLVDPPPPNLGDGPIVSRPRGQPGQ